LVNALACHNAGVVADNVKVVGLAPVCNALFGPSYKARVCPMSGSELRDPSKSLF
jgi:hypothetical protein